MTNDLKFKIKGVIRHGVLENWDKAQMTAALKGSFCK